MMVQNYHNFLKKRFENVSGIFEVIFGDFEVFEKCERSDGDFKSKRLPFLLRVGRETGEVEGVGGKVKGGQLTGEGVLLMMAT